MTTLVDPDPAAVLEGYVVDAARQRLRLLGWERDRGFVKSGGRIIYSIDTDILKLFLDPVGTAIPHSVSGKDPAPGYARIFRHDPPELSIALGRALAEFIFFRLPELPERPPILMLPPLEREVGGMFEAIVRDADREHHDALAELARLRENLKELVERLHSTSSRAEQLRIIIDAMPRLHDLLFGHSGPSAELERFAVLLERSRLTDFSRFLSEPCGVPSDVVEHLHRHLSSIRSWIEFSHLQGQWEHRLESFKSRRSSRKNVETDCRALARLEQINRMLMPFDVRVTHVTGDRAIFEAADSYCSDDDDRSFAEFNLRDPRTFLAEPSVLFAEGELERRHAKDIVPWLDVFLAKFTGAKGASSDELGRFLKSKPEERRSIVRQVLKRDPEAGRVFAAQWNEFCGPLALEHVQSTAREDTSYLKRYLSILSRWADGLGGERQRDFRQAAGAFQAEAGQLESILGDLENLVVERVLETWRSCFDAATSTGFSLLHFGLEEDAPARSPPPITFETIQAASDFFSEMLSGGHGGRYRQTIEDLRREDQSGYLFYLAFGALFAAEGKWHIAHMLATRALAIAEDEDSRACLGKITGREAYYLRAVARKLTARDHANFDEASKDLDLAREALQRSRENNPDLTITALRFDAEEAALGLSRHLYDLFAEGAIEQEPSPERLDPLRDRIYGLLDRVDGELPDGIIRERVRRALLVNYMTCLILRARSPSGDIPRAEIHDWDRTIFHRLRRSMEEGTGGLVERSYLHHVVFLAARALFEPPRTKGELRDLRDELERRFDKSILAANAVTIYDRHRFQFMYRFTKHLLDEKVQRGGRRVRP